MLVQLVSLLQHVVLQPLILLQLHFTSSKQVWLATRGLVLTGIHAFVQLSQLRPHSELDLSCCNTSLDVNLAKQYLDQLPCVWH